MKVVLDTNVIIADFYLLSPEIVTLLTASRKGAIELYIPNVVLDEAVYKFQQYLEKLQSEIQSGIDKLSRLTQTKFEHLITSDFMQEKVINYKDYIKKVISINDIKVLPYPVTPHQYIAKKAMQKKKPFNANEKGYRDSLIWENIKALIPNKDVNVGDGLQLVFITANHKDFLTDEQDFHSDLVSELEIEGLRTDYIFSLRRVSEFNKEFKYL